MTTRSTRSPRRRTVVALAVVLAVLTGFIVRLVDIQVVNAREHIEASLDIALAGSRTLYGARGEIVDADGETLAGSILLYDGVLNPKNITLYEQVTATKTEPGFERTADDGTKTFVPWAQALTEIAEITGQPAEEIQKAVDDAVAGDADSQYARFVTRLTTAQFRELDERGIPYLTFDSHPARTYPDGAVGGNLIGFVGSDAEPLAGLELTEQSCLAATDGSLAYQRGKDGVTIPGTRVEQPAVDGGTLQLTIDRDLQWYLQQLIGEEARRLKAKSGTITVVEVATGKVRAAAEYPTVDPNDIDSSDPDYLFSQIFTDTFEPGSTFKALTAASLIDSGKATQNSTVTAASREKFPNGARVGDAFGHPEYTYTLTGVLIDSSNVGISKFAERLSAQKRYDYLDRFGVGHGSAIGFGGEVTGVLHPVDKWDNQTYYNVSFGQGVQTTVPELVGAYQAIANDGVKVPLSLIESCTQSDGTVVVPKRPDDERVVSEKTAVSVQAMLENVSTQGALAKQVKIPGYRVATKTGTAQKTDGNGRYKSGVYFTTMIGFAPADDPQYVVAVTFDEPTRVKSSAANAPAFQKAMTQVLKNYRVMPATSKSPKLPKFG